MSDEVFGEGYSATYDEVYADKDYASECDVLEEVFGDHAARPVRTVLDLGCGTGRHSLELASRGYLVTGIDRSEAMLARARRSVAERGLGGRFAVGDVRSARVDQRFDAVLMMFAVLGYQLRDADVEASLETVRRHLLPGGVFVFDVWFAPAVEASGPEEREREVEIGGEVWRRTSSGIRRPGEPLVDVTISLEPRTGGEVMTETHTVRYFGRDDLERYLEGSGLELVLLRSFDDLSREPDEGSWNVLGVAVLPPEA